MNTSELFNKITLKFPKEEVCAWVDDCKEEYLPDDWEEEFSSMEEAYVELGRNSAETDVLDKIISETAPDLSIDEHASLFDDLAKYYELQVD